MASVGEWVAGARPRTLPTAISPVLVGTGAAVGAGAVQPLRALLALVVAVALVVGVNYANDYSDGIRGTDDERVGPMRLVGSRLAAPAAVRPLDVFFAAAVRPRRAPLPRAPPLPLVFRGARGAGGVSSLGSSGGWPTPTVSS